MSDLRLLILRDDAEEVMCGADGRLPLIELPPSVRRARYLTSAIRDRWDIDVLCLAVDERQIAWMEVVSLDKPLPTEWHWTKRDAIADPEVHAAFAEVDDYRHGRRVGPFARIAWLRDFYAWAERHLSDDARFTGAFEQWNCGPSFCLVRFELAPRGAVWLKAVGEPNLHEIAVTSALAARHPAYLPRVLATHNEWNAMLLEDVDAPSLLARPDPDAWRKAVQMLAEMQIDWRGDVSHLLAAGCIDCRLERLVDFLDPFFAAMERVFAAQPRTPPDVLASVELGRLGADTRAVCAELAATGIPASLGHGDFNPQNILVADSRTIALDWAAAHVGHPFMTFDALRHRLSREHPEHADWVIDMTQTYSAAWSSIYPATAVKDALRLARVVSPLACAYLCAHETGVLRLDEPRHPLYRALVRLVRHELRALSPSEVHR